MSDRPYFTKRWAQDHRNDQRYSRGWNNQQFNKGKKFYTKTLICKRQPFIKLFCPRCHTRCLKFGDYKEHLHADKHLRAIEKRIQFIEKEATKIREEQRKKQEAADKLAQTQGTSSAVKKYCEVCSLVFYLEESKHVASPLHQILQKLLKPTCKVCSYGAKDAVDYEHHICSLEHLKREENWTGEDEFNEHKEQSQQHSDQAELSQPSSSREASGNITRNVLSSGNSPNESANDGAGESANPRKTETATGPTSSTTGSGGDLSVVIEVQALFCPCCNTFFSSDGGSEAAKIKHCRTTEHLRMWVKYVEQKGKAEQEAVQNNIKM